MCATNHCNCEPDLRLPNTAILAPDGRIPDPALKTDEASSSVFFGHPAHIPITRAIKSDDATNRTISSRILPYIIKIPSNQKLRLILATSQPVHALAIISVGVVFTCLTGEQSTTPKPYSGLTTFAYIASFGLRLGSQYWMTFISGLSLYFTLQRHAFGDVQVVLFPRYFTSNAILSAICLFSYTKLHSHVEWQSTHWVQIIIMSTSFLLESLSRLYLAPKVVELIGKKKAIESTVPGVGKEIGKHDPGALKMCPHYMALHGQFRRNHMAMAMINMTTIACTIVQLCYISQSLCFHPC